MMTLKTVRARRFGLIGFLVFLMTASTQAQESPAPHVDGSNPSNEEASPFSIPPRSRSGMISSLFNRELFGNSIFEHLATITETPKPVVDPGQVHLDEARKHQSANRWSQALAETALAIEANPREFKAYELRADLYESKHLYAHAIATMSDAIAACPDNPAAWADRGSYRCIQQDRAGGLADIKEGFRCLDGDPANLKRLRSIRGAAHANLGDDRRCVEEYDSIITDGSFEADDLTARGRSLIRLGEFDRAVADLDRALAIEFDSNRVYFRGLARLRAGRFVEAVADLEQTGKVTVQSCYGPTNAGTGVPERWAISDFSKKSSTDRFCRRSVWTTVKIRSANRQPDSLCEPKEFFRHNTPARKTRSAWLFVGSTPSTPANSHNAG